MAHGGALPEQSTTKLERAQWDYDRAILLRDQTRAALAEKDNAINVAREKLEKAKREAAEAIPVDRSARQLSGGGAVTEDHREINPESGQQKGYIVLTPAERAKGFVRPVRRSYVHLKCGAVTTMGQALAETYARDPFFYAGTFCGQCCAHFPVGEDGEFVWFGTDEKVGT